MTNTRALSLDHIIPAGVLETDHWHIGRNDGTCSRCRRQVEDHDVPLMLYANDGGSMLIYCSRCVG